MRTPSDSSPTPAALIETQYLQALADACVDGVLVYCRAGFEREAGEEIQALARSQALPGELQAEPGQAFALLQFSDPIPAGLVAELFAAPGRVFARQTLLVIGHCPALPSSDRAGPIAEATLDSGLRYSALMVEPADSDHARTLSGFCRRFSEPLARQLEKRGRLRARSNTLPRLHVFFPAADEAWLALGLSGLSNDWAMGIPRLRVGKEAPSRSAGKLIEAIECLLNDDERSRLLRPGLSAVDLGAAPGGWSWVLAQRGLRVTAVDNGPMAASAMATGLIEHERADGFGWRPHRPVEWLVCDMVEQPARIAALVADWLASGRCRRVFANLKLPMKKRLLELERCRQLIERRLAPQGAYQLRIRQLYHDREEVTLYLAWDR